NFSRGEVCPKANKANQLCIWLIGIRMDSIRNRSSPFYLPLYLHQNPLNRFLNPLSLFSNFATELKKLK
ncbi:hypothetical protein, partial [Bacillus cereus]|uniref:hypothetical protein n=1 Tax=Bacillus cereus TaxID=1396 RepID=UPI00197AD00F